MQPRENAYGYHQIECSFFESERMDVGEMQPDAILHTLITGASAGHVKHGRRRVHRVHGVAVFRQSDAHQSCSASDLENPRILAKTELPDPGKGCVVSLLVDSRQ